MTSGLMRDRGRAIGGVWSIVAFVAILMCLLSYPAKGQEGFASAQPAQTAAPQTSEVTLAVPSLILRGIGVTVAASRSGEPFTSAEGWQLTDGAQVWQATINDGKLVFEEVRTDAPSLTVQVIAPDGTRAAPITRDTAPGWVSVLPALIAIVAVLVLRQVVPALTLGIWIGAALAHGIAFPSLWFGFLDILPVYVTAALTDADNLAILIFSIMIGGLVGILTRNGGMAGIASLITRMAHNPQRAQGATNLLGFGVFFDDYANTLIVGNTMRPITDQMKVSREKLAYIVDSTAAPVASLAIVTTWIGFMVSVIDDGLEQQGITDVSAYSVFLDTLGYSFYPILALVLVATVAYTGRDFGPMLTAERRARAGNGTMRDLGDEPDLTSAGRKEIAEAKPNALIAIIPLLVLIFGTLGGIVATGMAASESGASIRDIFGAGNSFHAMMWASISAVIVAVILSRLAGRMDLEDSMEAWMAGTRSMMLPAVVLSLAWAIAEVNGTIQTADVIVTFLGDSVALWSLPMIVFVLSAAMAFTTGTSWGVMGIMMPLVLPLAFVATAADGGLAGPSAPIFYATIASVLGGAVWGDHCSPISDTTVMSSLASGCDHADHVRTQLPYAIYAAGISVLAGLIPVGLGVAWWIALPIAAALLVAGFIYAAEPVERKTA